MSNRVGVLGPIEITAADRSTVDTGGKRQRRLLAALAVRAGDVVSLDSLVDIVFEGNPTESAERTLQSYVSRLRRAVDGENHSNGTAIERTSPGYVLRLETDDLDASCFVDRVHTARDHAASGDHAAAVRGLDDALRLWRGRPFAEFADEPWALAESERLSEIRATAIEDRAESQLALGGHAEVVADLERFSREEATRERPRAQLMLALYRSGRQAEALRVYQDYSRYLGEEIGLEPSATLHDLESKIIASDPSLEAEPLGGEKLRGYQLYEELGRGAFSVVHRGTQPSVGRDVAVKVIRAELANEPDFVRRFETEAHMVANLEHPHIVPLYDFWREPDNAYLVMRWLRGGTLRDQLAQSPMSLEEASRLVRQVGGALEAAHRRGIVHRDIKPANVFCDDDGNYYLGDFGIAIGSIADDEYLAPLTIAPAYASPELLERRAIGPAADIYSLGATAFEALTGAAPFADATSDAELVERQCHEPLPLISSIRSGVPTSIDQVIQRATAKSAIGRHASAADFVDAFGAAVAEATGATVRSVSPAPSAVPGPNPYKGLRAFQEADAAEFFGRSALTAELVQVLSRDDHEGRLLTVVGPSGSGKSSVVRAGLIPALRDGALPGSEDWFVATVLPGSSPFAELEAALLRIAVNPPGTLMEQLRSGPDGISRAVKRVLPDDRSELVVVIDQFEELFTLVVEADEREAFLEALVHAVDDHRARVRVVATLRADFYDRPLRDPVVADAIKLSTVAITPLASDELAEAIAAPARNAGGSFEDGLVARIAADVADQPGSLPLLQYSLAELYERTGGQLTHHAYESLGGVTGALAGQAETIFRKLDNEGHEGARRLFARLVTLGEEGDDTRRRIPLHELGSDPGVATALDAYGSSRLLAFDRDAETREPTVEVAHEALIREWPRYRSWVDDDRDGLRIHRHLTVSATSWHNRGEDDADLYRGSRLETASTWAEAHPGELNELEQRFLETGQRQSDEDTARAARHTRRLRGSLAAVGVVAIVALIAGALALREQRDADDARSVADAARDELEARNANVSRDLRIENLRRSIETEQDRALALLLALEVEALTDDGDPAALDALAHALLKDPSLVGELPAGWMVPVPALDAVLTSEPGSLVLRRADNPELVERRIPISEEEGPRTYQPAIAPDGRRVAVGTADGLAIVDLATGETGSALIPDGVVAGFPATDWLSDQQLIVNTEPVAILTVDDLDLAPLRMLDLSDRRQRDTTLPGTQISKDPGSGLVAIQYESGSIEIWDSDRLGDDDQVIAEHTIDGTDILLPSWTGAGDLLIGAIDPGSTVTSETAVPDSRFWFIPKSDLSSRTAVDAEVPVWNIHELSDGTLFAGVIGGAALIDTSGGLVAGPWQLDDATAVPIVSVEIGDHRIAIATIDADGFGPAPISIRSRARDELPLRAPIPGLNVPADRIVQHLPDSEIATVQSQVPADEGPLLYHAIHVHEVWDLRDPAAPTRIDYDPTGEFDRARVSETDTGPVLIGITDPGYPGNDALGFPHAVRKGEASLIDLHTGETIAEIDVDADFSISGLYVSRDRGELTVFGNNGILVYDVATERSAGDLQISPVTTWLVRNEDIGLGFAVASGGLTIYDLESLQEIAHEQPDRQFDNRILPDETGTRVVVGGSNRLMLADLPGLTDPVYVDNPNGLAGRLDPSGQVIIGWGSKPHDGVQLWHATTGQPLGPFVPGPVGDQHIGGGIAQVSDGEVYVWDIRPEAWGDQACAAVARTLTQEEWRIYVSETDPYDPVDCTDI